MSDNGFPSGPWVGFYNYGPGDRHRMDLHLDFANGSMSGEGNDDVGRFLIRGKFDPVNRECFWTKTYPGSHDVYYRGFQEGRGIWGIWEIGIFAHGGFNIWPKGEHEGEMISAAADAADTVEAIGKDQEAGVSTIPADSLNPTVAACGHAECIRPCPRTFRKKMGACASRHGGYTA